MQKTIDFSLIKKTFFNEISKRHSVITNSDLDGIFSATLLCSIWKHLQLCGFTNSNNKISLVKDIIKDDALYVDIFMVRENVCSIDNHIVGSEKLPISDNLKINPNIIYGTYMEDYINKFPFSTFIFLLSLIDNKYFNLNIDIDKIIGSTSDGSKIYLWELLLRADDTLYNSYEYKRNATNWWGKLLKQTDNTVLYSLYKKVIETNTKENALFIKNKIKQFLFESFNLKSDGFNNIKDPNFVNFLTFCSSILGYELKYSESKIEYDLINKREEFSKAEDITEIHRIYNPISLAIINKNKISFSYINKKQDGK